MDIWYTYIYIYILYIYIDTQCYICTYWYHSERSSIFSYFSFRMCGIVRCWDSPRGTHVPGIAPSLTGRIDMGFMDSSLRMYCLLILWNIIKLYIHTCLKLMFEATFRVATPLVVMLWVPHHAFENILADGYPSAPRWMSSWCPPDGSWRFSQ